ncbi:Aqualysin 1 (plasmid) [Deinococcus proteolyticus MRP]|uniref:Aqualysin 1 n=1 Tax=Deinococcus proteolyticus (strain ATCC 35074 / DSM 20540 / JCM 6276 / NBRC 101906 / NCIMB 13154 / VKM Ac-1939 / CCM 2703 / MRP) TaxID=693977 RepID=F0RPQ9_DEIPM|nr:MULTISPECIES: S8 family peptidase [Deinococcus]ADY27365.1 Aqualysin 1 [Deinococcus proteolyticus MRP]MCY1704238.1 S8 family peptidase [Deinococcus sp. SL84]
MKKTTFVALGLGLLLASCGNAPSAPSTPAAPAPEAGQGLTQVPNPERARSAGELAPLIEVDQKNVIDGQYIVVLSEGALGSDLSAQSESSLIQAFGLQPQGVTMQYIYGQALEGFAAQLSAENLQILRADPRVKYIEQDQVMRANATQSGATWGLDRVDQRTLPLNGTYVYNTNASNVTSYIIDTGILTTHNDFGGRAVWGTNQTGDGRNTDCNGHGTHVAGTVGGSTYGVAKATRLVAVKVLGCDGSGSNSGVIAGINWAASNRSGPAVANMSLGGGASQATDDAVSGAVNRGLTMVVAAGNENQNACNVSPARAPLAITVGATTRSDARSSFSNYGSCVDINAPGSDITSAWYTGNSATNTISGTSMASPHVAGGAALVLSTNPSYTPAQVASTLNANATTGQLTGLNGSPNRLLYTLAGTGTTPTPTPTPTPAPGERTFTGTVSQGNSLYAPSASGEARSGTITLQLTGPSGTDFDLFLQRWNGSSWVDVASSESTGSSERISTSVTSGTYRYEVYAYSGSGSFTLTVQ